MSNETHRKGLVEAASDSGCVLTVTAVMAEGTGAGMASRLNAVQEHYLKREFLKFQLLKEFEQFNDPRALRRFGYPFSAGDPKDSAGSRTVQDTEFPMCSFILREFIMTFPLLSKNIAVDESFWQQKVQVFFEHFMSLGFSESYDRDKATKRRKISMKLTKIILLLFNSGVGTLQEVAYYNNDKFTLQANVRERSKVEEFAIPTRETLQYFVTSEPMYINHWDINVIAVVKESLLFDHKRKKSANAGAGAGASSSLNYYTSSTLKSFSNTSKWMTKTIVSTPSNLLSKLSIKNGNDQSSSGPSGGSSNCSYYFIIRVRYKESPEQAVYTAKTYNDFKKFAHNLKESAPGHKFPKLPHKTKKSISVVTRNETLPDGRVPSNPTEQIVHSFETETQSLLASANQSAESLNKSRAQNAVDVFSNDDEDEDETTFEDFEDAMDTKTNKLAHEKMRTSLRQYLRSLSKDKDTSVNPLFSSFLTTDDVVEFEKFKEEVREDIRNRQLVDINVLVTQLKFQKLALEKSLKLQDSMKDLKTSLLQDEKALLSYVNEIKEKEHIAELSQSLQAFIEWFKIYFASMLYQLFLGNDNSYGFYTQIRRLHKLMPYSMMSQIMRFTNPMTIMKSLMDLFMAQPFGGHSLLQTMFSSILMDDLRSQANIIKNLEKVITKESQYASQMIKSLKKFVFPDDKSTPPFTMEDIHKESTTMDMPTCLIILMKYADLGQVSSEAVDSLIDSYSIWKAEPESTGGQYFQHVKELLQLYIKERDKRLMRQLWQDPELAQLLKAMVTMIYEPMVRIFKVAKMDVALKNLERFMSDLIKLMDSIINGTLGTTSTQFNVIDALVGLITKHQDLFYMFVHDVYINDTEGIFEGFIVWISRTIRFLQKSKFGAPETRIDLGALVERVSDDVDVSLLISQLDSVIHQKTEARRLYRELVEHKLHAGASKRNISVNKMVQEKWKAVNAMVVPSSSLSLGLADGELVDLDLDAKDYDYLERDGDGEDADGGGQRQRRQPLGVEVQRHARPRGRRVPRSAAPPRPPHSSRN
ncbi:Lec1p KNAG_0A07460 [Huiozyma naganishii CBS 8797]|uniref:PX domain-containing protein n=1 Tax=Huiozyma naganishii (strain ATCC MYA-139 / BCRC 22969 / CBS 8797 / KCTC 17520 / NBRC 10181 / NCYC 3082 / Yp74L-3) TaxID=1071383 RepID=J7S2X8_HUIN7|nr:hypothetical protein KNAG_0A07460 [Kazachstania naganishii CBS 8797]CCK68399.1 hypothetical protein KNAG_0A07460 [Kazachstania naganishii CBS 8797]